MFFVRLFDLRLFGLSVSSSSWCLGRAAACDCGTPWTFILPFLFDSENSDQPVHPRNLIRVFADRMCLLQHP